MSVTIETPNLKLREFESRDVGSIFCIASQPGFIFYNLDQSRETSQAFVDRAISFQKPRAERIHYKLAVTLKNDQLIGYTGIDNFPTGLEGEIPDIGYLIDPRFQRRGYATEAMEGLICFLYARVAPRDLDLTVHPENVASIKVAKKLGFHETGATEISTIRGREPRLRFLMEPRQFYIHQARRHGYSI